MLVEAKGSPDPVDGTPSPRSVAAKARVAHPLPVRLSHWINAFAILAMIASGWRIYNASPLFDFSFPKGVTLGGWLGGALLWHFAAMWVLVLNGFFYVAHGVASGHFRRDFLPVTPRAVLRDMKAALTLRLPHRLGHYNAVQRLLYIGVLALGVLVVLSGLAIWKPVQLSALTDTMGGYEIARRVHFAAMAGIVGFIVVHVALVLIVPRTLVSMIVPRPVEASDMGAH